MVDRVEVKLELPEDAVEFLAYMAIQLDTTTEKLLNEFLGKYIEAVDISGIPPMPEDLDPSDLEVGPDGQRFLERFAEMVAAHGRRVMDGG